MASTDSTAAPRQVVLLCDGTNNTLTAGRSDTNVVLLTELLRAHPDPNRLVYYDPGVGNPADLPGTTPWDRWRRWFERVDALAFGSGVLDNVAEGYRFLMHHWREGDQIWLFGFSRGAFTARSIAGLINRFGIVQPHQEAVLGTLLHLYFTDKNRSALGPIQDQAARLFTRDVDRMPPIHFVGVWDTVATVGLPPFQLRFSAIPSLKGKRFVHVRHALALDEHRLQFKPRIYAENNGPVELADGSQGSVQQLWFRGAHADVGGGYALDQAALSREPLCWLIAQAAGCGLRLGQGPASLADESLARDAVSRLIERITQAPDPVAHRTGAAPVHSQLHATPLWALTGMQVRNTTCATRDGQAPVRVALGRHESVTRWPGRFPQDTAWNRGPWGRGFWIALAACVGFFFALGQLLHGLAPTRPDEWMGTALGYLRANGSFQWWQLEALVSWGPAWWDELRRFDSPRWALLWDFGFIASYASVLSALAAWGFARAAALHDWGREPSVWLNRLGLALPLMVLADIAENLVTWAAISLRAIDATWLSGGLSLLITPLGLLKFLGLLGVAALVLGHRWLRPAPPTSPRQKKTA